MPETHHGDIAHASALFKGGDTDAACEAFNRVLGCDPCNVAALHGSGLCLHKRGQRDPAIALFRQAVALDPAAWACWQSIADLTSSEAERRRAIDQAADILLAASRGSTSSATILHKAVPALVCAGRSAQARQLLLEHMPRFDDLAQAHALLAGTFYADGQFESAAYHQWLALQQTPAQPPGPGPSAIEPDRAMDVLLRLCAHLEAGGFRPFLMAGTLLGLVRSGSVLAHDRDLDIGLMRGNGGEDPVEFIRKHPDLLLPHAARPGDRYIGLTVDGIAADIFVFDEMSAGMVCGFSALYRTSPYAIAYLALARARTCLLAGNLNKAAALLQQLPQSGRSQRGFVAPH